MQVQHRRNGIALVLFILGFMVLVTLALASTTWAAPNAQGTIPTPPNATAQPTSAGGGGNGGGQDSGGQNSGGQDTGGQNAGGESGSPTAAAPVPGAGSVCAIAENGAQCSVENLIVVVGAGAAPAGSAFTIEGPFGQPPCPASPDGNNFLNRCYRYGWIGTNAQPLTGINAPVQYCLGFGPEQIAATNNKTDSLLVGFAAADGQWTVVKPIVDTAGNRACATTNQQIVWSALFAPKAASTLLPTVGGDTNAWWMVPLALLGVVMMLGAIRLARQGTR
jgi:hypothetical protein